MLTDCFSEHQSSAQRSFVCTVSNKRQLAVGVFVVVRIVDVFMPCIQQTGFCTSSFYLLYQLSWFWESGVVESCVHKRNSAISLKLGDFVSQKSNCAFVGRIECRPKVCKVRRRISIPIAPCERKRNSTKFFLSISLRFQLEISSFLRSGMYAKVKLFSFFHRLFSHPIMQKMVS